MTTIIVDDDEIHWSWTACDPKFVPRTICQLLAEEFSPEANFYVSDGQPYMVFPMWDLTTGWYKPDASQSEFAQDKYECMSNSQMAVSGAYVNRYGARPVRKPPPTRRFFKPACRHADTFGQVEHKSINTKAEAAIAQMHNDGMTSAGNRLSGLTVFARSS